MSYYYFYLYYVVDSFFFTQIILNFMNDSNNEFVCIEVYAL